MFHCTGSKDRPFKPRMKKCWFITSLTLGFIVIMTILTWGYTPTYNQWDHLVGIYSRSKCLLVAIMIGMGCAPVGANPKNDDDFGPKAPLVEKTPFTDFFQKDLPTLGLEETFIYIYILS